MRARESDQRRSWILVALVSSALVAFVPISGASGPNQPVGGYSPPGPPGPPPDGYVAAYSYTTPGSISPNQDGCNDESSIFAWFYWPSNASEHAWSVSISGAGGTVFTTSGTQPIGAYDLVWTGTGPSGTALPDGRYHVKATAQAKVSGELKTGSSTSVIIIDTKAPSIISRFPESQQIVIGGETVEHGTTTAQEVRATFDEDFAPYGYIIYFDGYGPAPQPLSHSLAPPPRLEVLSEAGTSVDGYDWYDSGSRTVTWRSFDTMLGRYLAFVSAKDAACNVLYEEWGFVAAATDLLFL